MYPSVSIGSSRRMSDLCLPLWWLRPHLQRLLRNLYFSFSHLLSGNMRLLWRSLWWSCDEVKAGATGLQGPVCALCWRDSWELQGYGWEGRKATSNCASLFCLQHIPGGTGLSPFWHQDFSCLRTSLGDTHLESQHMGD